MKGFGVLYKFYHLFETTRRFSFVFEALPHNLALEKKGISKIRISIQNRFYDVEGFFEPVFSFVMSGPFQVGGKRFPMARLC